MTGNENFESRLLTELRQVSAENPEPRTVTSPRRPYGRFAAAGTGIAAVIAAVAIFASSGGNTPSAYAVETKPDGMVTVKIKSLTDADGLEKSLNAAGIPADVNYTPVMPTVDCGVNPKTAPGEHGSDKGSDSAPKPSFHTEGAAPAVAAPTESKSARPSLSEAGIPADASKTVSMTVSSGTDGSTFSIAPGEMKPGEKVYITTAGSPTSPRSGESPGAPSPASIAVAIDDKPAPVPGC